MSEDSGRIELDGDVIRYRSETFDDWTAALADVRIIGEATNQNGPFSDDYFLCFSTGLDLWYEASFDAEGRDIFLETLRERLGCPLEISLFSSTDFASRILWPVELAGKPMFKFDDMPPKTPVGWLIGSMRNEQRYSECVVEALNK